MNDPNSPSLRGWNQPQGFGGGFPGIGNPGFGNPGFGPPTAGGDPFFVAGPPALVNPTVLPPQFGGAGAGGGTGKGFNFGDIKGFIDRMGGIDGVLNGLGKFQKLMSTMQQMAPLLRLLIGKGGTAAAAGISSGKVRRRSSRTRRRARARKGGSRRTHKR
ncbi:hypothetical protein [Cohnella caldifontis]|uniref:hypothetical protein n=1 Tax=Cohnella caldifontis TaxID=3027471 RepID=UPI0023EC26BA|nr:hypothetical protein [Cohnella sp. YIM B05605]